MDFNHGTEKHNYDTCWFCQGLRVVNAFAFSSLSIVCLVAFAIHTYLKQYGLASRDFIAAGICFVAMLVTDKVMRLWDRFFNKIWPARKENQ